VCVCVSNRVT